MVTVADTERWMWTLTLFDHAPFHEDDAEDHKQQPRLRVGRAPDQTHTL